MFTELFKIRHQGVQVEETRSKWFLSCRCGQAVQIDFNQSYLSIQQSTLKQRYY